MGGSPIKLALGGLLVLLVSFGAVTWWVLESSGVAIIETRAPDGTTRETHVWFVEPGGELWLEAGTPSNPWFVDVGRDPRLGFRADGRKGEYTAQPMPSDAAHDRVRSQLRAKYGLRDWWVGWLVDPSASVAVRLVAREG
jgi:hypothetical protein